jgi:hypothetical protein
VHRDTIITLIIHLMQIQCHLSLSCFSFSFAFTDNRQVTRICLILLQVLSEIPLSMIKQKKKKRKKNEKKTKKNWNHSHSNKHINVSSELRYREA